MHLAIKMHLNHKPFIKSPLIREMDAPSEGIV